jgi:hypothetical protein
VEIMSNSNSFGVKKFPLILRRSWDAKRTLEHPVITHHFLGRIELIMKKFEQSINQSINQYRRSKKSPGPCLSQNPLVFRRCSFSNHTHCPFHT